MRAIEFRGQCLGSKKWVYGSLITSDNGAQIHVAHNELYAVDPETVGQFIGQFDKDGKDIYEGDVLRALADSDCIHQSCVSDVICDDNDGYKFCVRSASTQVMYGLSLNWTGWTSLEILGNVYDNPELLKNE